MALLPFKKLTLIAHASDEEKILTLLSRTGSAEIIKTSEIEHCAAGDANDREEGILSESAELAFCLDFWRAERTRLNKIRKKQTEERKITNYEPKKVSLLDKIRAKKPDVSFDEFDRIGADRSEVRAAYKRLREISQEESELKGEESRNLSLIEQLSYYTCADIPFDRLKGDRRVSVSVGLVPADLYKGSDFADLPVLYLQELGERQRVVTLFVAYPTEERGLCEERLSAIGFSKATFTFPMTATEKIAELRARNEEIFRTSVSLAEEAVAIEDKMRPQVEILFDYCRVEQEKCQAIDKTFRSGTSFVLTAWVPAHLAESTETALGNSGATYYSIYEDPKEGEAYPTFTKNNPVVAPYESITNMYSAPSPREIDPNPFVAFFYFVLFGLMVSDAAYGLILALFGFGLYAIRKPRKGEGQLLLVIGMGGVSTLIWGIMFGGYFGETFHPVLFSPMNDPMSMLILSIGMGVFQILFGMGIAFVAKCKNKKPLEAIFGEGSWFVLFIALGLFVMSGMLSGMSGLKLPSLILLGMGGAGVLIGGALGRKGLKGKLAGAFSNVYGVTGFMSDILSYCRLFGLGLATGVVGMVVNKIAFILMDLIPVVGYLLFVAVLVVGHVFNIAINTLGAYVHNSRLQYVEFFSRFYTGGGHIFKPMGSNLKYIYLSDKGGKEL